jgi:hypothetical protein
VREETALGGGCVRRSLTVIVATAHGVPWMHEDLTSFFCLCSVRLLLQRNTCTLHTTISKIRSTVRKKVIVLINQSLQLLRLICRLPPPYPKSTARRPRAKPPHARISPPPAARISPPLPPRGSRASPQPRALPRAMECPSHHNRAAPSPAPSWARRPAWGLDEEGLDGGCGGERREGDEQRAGGGGERRGDEERREQDR